MEEHLDSNSISIHDVDPEFLDDDFNATRYILRQVIGNDDDEALWKSLTSQKSIADQAIRKAVNENFNAFSDSLESFADIYQTFESTQNNIKTLSSDVKACRVALSQNSSSQLPRWLERQATAADEIKKIEMLQSLQSASQKLSDLASSRSYVKAIDVFNQSFETMFSDEIVKLEGTSSMRDSLIEFKQVLEDGIIDEILQAAFLKSELENDDDITDLFNAGSRLGRTAEIISALKNLLEPEFRNLVIVTLSQYQSSARKSSHDIDENISLLSTASSSSSSHHVASYLSILFKKMQQVQNQLYKIPDKEFQAQVEVQLKLALENVFHDIFDSSTSPSRESSASSSRLSSRQRLLNSSSSITGTKVFQFSRTKVKSISTRNSNNITNNTTALWKQSAYHIPRVYQLICDFLSSLLRITSDRSLIEDLVEDQLLPTIKDDITQILKETPVTCAKPVVNVCKRLVSLSHLIPNSESEFMTLLEFTLHKYVGTSSRSFRLGTRDLLANTTTGIGIEAFVNDSDQFDNLLWEDAEFKSFVKQSSTMDFLAAELDSMKLSSSQLPAIVSQCKSLSKSVIEFLTREIECHCYYFLNKLTLEDFDLSERDDEIVVQQCIEDLNADLRRMFTSVDECQDNLLKTLFAGLPVLLPEILIMMVRTLVGRRISRFGVSVLLLNVCAMKQNLSQLFYGKLDSDFREFTNVERFIQLLTLSTDDLFDFIKQNKKSYDDLDLKALFQVVTEHRMPTNENLAQLDALLAIKN